MLEGFSQGAGLERFVLRRDAFPPILLRHRISENKAPMLVFVHGFKGFMDWGAWAPFCRQLTSGRAHLAMFNFSCNGGTVNEPIDFPDLEAFASNTYSKEQQDLADVVDYLDMTYGDRINGFLLVGHSRGGSMAILRAARDARIRGLITLAAVADLEARFQAYDIEDWRSKGRVFTPNARTNQDMPLHFSFYEDFVGQREELDVLASVARIQVPWLIVHAKDDPVVDTEEAQKLQERATTSELFLTESGGHTFGSKHPWNSKDLPPSLTEVLSRCKAFLQAQSG